MTSNGSRLKGKVALVTGKPHLLHWCIDADLLCLQGAASGFGKAIAIRYAQEGCRVMLADVNSAGCKDIISSLGAIDGDDLKVASMNVTQAEDWKDVVATCVRNWGRLDIVVNNAGTTYRNKPTLEVTNEEFDKVFLVNVKSIYLSVLAVVPQMQKNGGGSIINISSIGSVRPRPGLVWYNASKGAVTNVPSRSAPTIVCQATNMRP